jgi:hypothetical protein
LRPRREHEAGHRKTNLQLSAVRLTRQNLANQEQMLRALVLIAFATFLVGCSSVGGSPMTVLADPAKYKYSTCESLNRQRQTWMAKEQDLRQLMDRAEQSAGGSVVNILAYKGDHVAATEELELIEHAAQAKNCNSGANWPSNSALR